jgi:hypothetical protein
VRQLVGERAVCYLRFQRVLLWVASLYFAVGVTVLLPLNLTGRVCDFAACPADIEARVLQFGDRVLFMTVRALPGRLSGLSVPQRFPMKMYFA